MTVTLQQYGLDQLDSASSSELAILLWDSLEQETSEVPESHRLLLDERCAALDASQSTGIVWDELKKTLRVTDASA